MVSGEEPILLMHYLDIVFYLQYPMYKSSVVDGGRGWVLSLLLRTKPLYHAALALSAYHRGAVLLASQRDGPRHPGNLVEQEEHLTKFFEEFQRATNSVGQWVEQKHAGDCMAILSAIVQLVFFEVGSIGFPRMIGNHTDTPRAFRQSREYLADTPKSGD
jgi:hypothetical protein